jgi:hypothetical protein
LQRIDKSASTLAFRMDDRKQRLVVNSDGASTISAYGWEMESAAALDALLPRELLLTELAQSVSREYVLFVLLHEGMTLGRRVWERVPQRGGERLELVEGTQALLRQLLHRAYPTNRNGVVPFQGGPAGLEVVTATPPLLGGAGRITVWLTLIRNGQLEIAWLPDTERRPTAVPRRSILLSDIAAMEMTYFGIHAEDMAPRWHPVWRNQPRQPLLVRIRLRFPAGDSRVWPDLLVAPPIDTDAECLPNTEGVRCAGRT